MYGLALYAWRRVTPRPHDSYNHDVGHSLEHRVFKRLRILTLAVLATSGLTSEALDTVGAFSMDPLSKMSSVYLRVVVFCSSVKSQSYMRSGQTLAKVTF